MAGGESLIKHLVHWHRNNIKSFRHPYSENELFSTFKVETQYNDASGSAVKMHHFYFSTPAQVQDCS